MTRPGLFLVSVLCLLSLACPKKVVNVAGSDDEQMDGFSAQLEELHTRQELKCDDYCSLKGKACDLNKSVCDIANRHADREDFQKKCGTAAEECARFNDGCASCK